MEIIVLITFELPGDGMTQSVEESAKVFNHNIKNN